MKVYMKPLYMFATFNPEGQPLPYRFKLPGTETIVKVDKIDFYEEEKLAGNRMKIYRCRSVIDSTERIYELKYELSTCKWYLFKM